MKALAALWQGSKSAALWRHSTLLPAPQQTAMQMPDSVEPLECFLPLQLQLACHAACSHAAAVGPWQLVPLPALQIVLLDAAETLPEGFLDHVSPQQEHVMDTSIYELHVRDFR